MQSVTREPDLSSELAIVMANFEYNLEEHSSCEGNFIEVNSFIKVVIKACSHTMAFTTLDLSKINPSSLEVVIIAIDSHT